MKRKKKGRRFCLKESVGKSILKTELESRHWQASSKEDDAQLIWTLDERSIRYDALKSEQIVNHFRNISTCTTKAGLTKTMDNLRWSTSADALSFFPRSFLLDETSSRADFIDDFRKTALALILRRIAKSAKIIVPVLIQAALHHQTKPIMTNWDEVLEYSYLLTEEHATNIKKRPVSRGGWRGVRELSRSHKSENLRRNLLEQSKNFWKEDKSAFKLKALRNECRQMIHKLAAHNPQWHIDGETNTWIIKAPEASSGRGLILLRSLDEVLSLADKFPGRVAQKYVETPLLWHDNTKFDLRLWCLIACDPDYGARVYVYDPCYARLCSRPFSLDIDLLNDPAVHLTNLAVQRKEANETDAQLMRNQAQIQQLLDARMKHAATWSQCVWPQILKILRDTSAAVVANASPRPRSFELLGIDIVLDDAATPWLLEANLSPALARRSEQHALTIADMLRGVISLTVDTWQTDDTVKYDSGWNLVCRHTLPPPLPQRSVGNSILSIQGTQIAESAFDEIEYATTYEHAEFVLSNWCIRLRRILAAHRKRKNQASRRIYRAVVLYIQYRYQSAHLLTRVLRTFLYTQRAKNLVVLRKRVIVKLQAEARGALVRPALVIARRRRHFALARIIRFLRAAYYRYSQSQRNGAAKIALETAQAANFFAASLAPLRSEIINQIHRAKCLLTAVRVQSTVKIQRHARSFLSRAYIERRLKLKRRFLASVHLQSFVRSFLGRKSINATKLQRFLKRIFILFSWHRSRNSAVSILQRYYRRHLVLLRNKCRPLLTIALVHAQLWRIIRGCQRSDSSDAVPETDEPPSPDILTKDSQFLQLLAKYRQLMLIDDFPELGHSGERGKTKKNILFSQDVCPPNLKRKKKSSSLSFSLALQKKSYKTKKILLHPDDDEEDNAILCALWAGAPL